MPISLTQPTIGSTDWGANVNANFATIESAINASPSIQAIKAPCRVATNTNILLTGQQTIDGVPCVSNDRVLVRAQSVVADNGIYTVQSGGWTRSADANTATTLMPGTIVHVNEGGALAGTLWHFSGHQNYVIGTSPINVRPISCPIYGTMRGDVLMVASGIQKLTEPQASGSPLLLAGVSRLTLGIGAAGVYRVRLRCAVDMTSEDFALVLHNLSLYKNGSSLINFVVNGGGLMESTATSTLRNGTNVEWEGYLPLNDGDYLEIWGSAGSQYYNASITFSMHRLP